MSDLPTDDYGALLAKLKGGGSSSAPSSEVEESEATQAEGDIEPEIFSEEVTSTNGHKPDVEDVAPHPADTARPARAQKQPAHVPPHDLEAEEYVLGAMMVGTEAARALFDIVSIEDFYTDRHRRIAEAILTLVRNDAPTDALAVYRELPVWARAQVGGAAYLTMLSGAGAVASAAPYHATAVAELSARRHLIDAVDIAAEGAYEGHGLGKVVGDLSARLELVERASEPGIQLLTIAQLRGLPPPAPLVEGIVSRDVFATLWGPSGHGKSLLALDMGLSVALGRSWFGREVHRGPVVMVVAEGAAGTTLRVDAWLSDRDEKEPDNFFVVAEAVNLFDEDDPQAFVRAVERFDVTPSLVVFDTLARSMVGGDENKASDMGIVIGAADKIRARSHATVLVVHHSGRGAEHERGSTALFGASDTVISAIKNEDGQIEIVSRKQKDRVDFDAFQLAIQPVDNSVVLVESALSLASEKPPPSVTTALSQLWHSFGTKPISRTQWKDVCDIHPRAFYRAVNWLVERGFVVEAGTEKRPIFTITSRGEELMAE